MQVNSDVLVLISRRCNAISAVLVKGAPVNSLGSYDAYMRR